MNEPLSLGLIYQMILQKNLSYKMKEKLCEERRFGVFKTLKTQELPGALPSGPLPVHCPWTPPGALEWAPGPHSVKTLRSLHSNWTQTIFIQHPAVTNPAHAHMHFSVNVKFHDIIIVWAVGRKHLEEQEEWGVKAYSLVSNRGRSQNIQNLNFLHISVTLL